MNFKPYFSPKDNGFRIDYCIVIPEKTHNAYFFSLGVISIMGKYTTWMRIASLNRKRSTDKNIQHITDGTFLVGIGFLFLILGILVNIIYVTIFGGCVALLGFLFLMHGIIRYKRTKSKKKQTPKSNIP